MALTLWRREHRRAWPYDPHLPWQRAEACQRSSGAEFIFVLHHVVLEGEEKTLCALGSEDLARIDTSLGQTGESGDEVEYEFLGAVVDDGQVAVSAVGDFGRQLDLELLTLFFFVCHGG